MTRVAIRRRQRIIARAKKMAERIKWPEGFKGGILWCEHCALEFLRIPEGESRTLDEQRAAKEAHKLVCEAQRLKLVQP